MRFVQGWALGSGLQYIMQQRTEQKWRFSVQAYTGAILLAKASTI